ncbi:MAG TPA: 4Fe-4S dicluster domain-containing protein, partial [Kofleriaceae bacterium]
LQTQLALEDADVIVSLDADLVAEHPMSVAYARRIADRRRVVDKHSAMSRIYAIESTYTRLGLLADHRFKATPAEIAGYATSLSGSPTGWLAAIARDLERAGARGVIVAGEHLPPEVHAICAQLNARSQVVRYTEPVAFEAGTASHSLDGVRAALLRGEVGSLVVVGYEPINLPVGSATQALFIGSHPPRETYHLTAPLLHALESWDVARAYDGTPTPIQPMIEPLVDGKAIDDVLHDLLGDPPEDRRDRAERAWAQLSTTPFDEALVRGVGTGSTPVVHGPIQAVSFTAKTAPLELVVRPHPFLHDGRYATNPWLRELPDPITKLSWDNAAQLSPATMRRLGLTNGELVLVDGTAIVPVIAVPGHADNVVTLFGDHGLRTGPVTVASTGEATELAITQPHGDMEGRPIALTGELATLAPEAYAEHRETHPSLISRDPPKGPQWAMHIDLTTCSGCTACVMACASENNTPVVGKQHVIERREMHWLRLDRYVDGEDVRVQPMACQHCENAPCEYVCPTAATTHSPDGLNEMTYNRCVGTRFCSNNCPYKVRRFNWFDFQERKGLRVYGKNPDVTVRDRGVMEKCTYCVQRIRRAEIDTRVDGKPLTVQTACQQACPTQAITFGTLDDVKELRARPHAYAVLDDQGTIPRTRYLARVRNRNPEIS